MEFGGRDAFIVLDDRFDENRSMGSLGQIKNTGQCCGSETLYCCGPVSGSLPCDVPVFVGGAPRRRPDGCRYHARAALDESSFVGFAGAGATSRSAWCRLVIGGNRIERPDSFIEATIAADIAPDNPAFRQEVFRPVALFFRVKGADAAIALANDSDFGLGGSVFTADVAKGKRVAGLVDTGMIFFNHTTWTAPDLPFGRIKDSGYGRELSSMGIDEFINKKHVRTAAIDAAA